MAQVWQLILIGYLFSFVGGTSELTGLGYSRGLLSNQLSNILDGCSSTQSYGHG